MKLKILLYVFSIFIFISCEMDKYKTIDFDVFSINVPNSWSKIEVQGIDGYSGAIITFKKDTIFFDYSEYASVIDDFVLVQDIKDYEELKSKGFPINDMFFSKSSHLDENQGVFHKEYYLYDTINGYTPKIKIPKKIGKGITAICFDSLSSEKIRFYMYAKDLDTIEQFQLLKAFKTIQFEKDLE